MGQTKLFLEQTLHGNDQKQALEDFEKVGLSEKENKIILGENANNLFNFF